jgi:hypothetical protein
MSTDENREEDTELSNSQESNTRPSKASTERDDEMTTKEPGEERKVVVVKPSEAEYKENNQIEYSSTEEQNKEEEGEGEVEQSGAATKAKEAGISFTEMIKTLGKKAVTKTEEKTKEIKDRSIEAMNIGIQTDSRDIQALGIHAGNVVLVYERIMFEIEREDYETQEKLLIGYKKLLEEQVNVIDSKLSIAKRLKNISK